ARDALIPAGDDLPGPQGKAERLIPISTAIELFAVREPAGVIHRDGAIGDGGGTLSLGDVLVAQAGRGLRHRGAVHLERRSEAFRRAAGVAVCGTAAGEETSRREEDE